MFDNPFLWVVAIWWLLSSFLGIRKKRRRAQQSAPAPIVEAEVYEASAGYQEALEPAPETIPAVPVQPQARATSSLQNLIKQLGLDKVIESVIDPEPSQPAPPEPIAAVRDDVVKTAAVPEEEEIGLTDAAPGTTSKPRTLSPLARLRRPQWTPAQQAMILKEVLDRPRSRQRLVH